MSEDAFSTPVNRLRASASSSRSTAPKRDSLAAELERDPQLSTAKRQQRAQVFTSSMAHAALERQLAAAHTAKAELDARVREKDALVERLERDRRWFADREQEERAEKERERAERQEEKAKLDADVRALRSALTALREEHADLEDQHASLSRSTTQKITAQKSQIATLERRTALLEEELLETKHIADSRTQTIQDIQEQLDELSAAQDTIIRGGAEEENMVVVREELHRQANYLRSLESTNAKLTAELSLLRDRHTSIEVLKEEKRGLERRLKSLDELRARVVTLEAEVEAGRREREEWASKASSTPSKTPISVTQSLSALRLTHARLLEDHGANVALLRSREAELADAERRNTESRERIKALEDEKRALTDKVDRRERRALLAEREVSFQKALIASFNAEETTQEFTKTAADSDRVQQLEALLEEYKASNTQLTSEIDALGGDALSLGKGLSRKALAEEVEREKGQRAEAQKAAEEAEAEAKQHLDKIEELEQTLFELGGEIAGGRHVPPGVRILSMKDNPEQAWFDLRQAALDRLKGENDALLRRLKELEAGGAAAPNARAEELVPRESWDLLSREKAELEDTVKQKEKRLLRLKQVFEKKSAEFREAIAAILGLKLAFYPNGQVRVTSVYDLTASFVFQAASQTAGARMQLVGQGEGGPEDLPDMMRIWVENEQCIPGFLASVTLLCYENWKQHGGEQGT